MNMLNEQNASDIELMLPWHAAGTLSNRDTQRVEAALASDPELARRYESVRDELGQTIHLNESLGAPSARAMAALFAKIDAEPVRKPAVSFNLGASVREYFSSLSPRTLAWSATAAAVAIMLQAAVIGGIVIKDHGTGNSFETASVPTTVSGEGSYVLVRFQPQVSAADVTRFLEANKLNLAGGPAPGGLYRVQVATKALPKDELDRILKSLQQDKVIGFVAVTR
jgi:hypothetical protein